MLTSPYEWKILDRDNKLIDERILSSGVRTYSLYKDTWLSTMQYFMLERDGIYELATAGDKCLLELRNLHVTLFWNVIWNLGKASFTLFFEVTKQTYQD